MTAATKFGEHWDAALGAPYADHWFDALRRSLDRSIARLGAIEVLQLHKTTPAALASDGVARAWEYARGLGITRLGPSVSDAESARLAMEDPRLNTMQFPFNRENQQFAPFLKEGMWIAVNRPFAMGAQVRRDAFRFILERKFTGVILTGTTSTEHLRENWEAFQESIGLTPGGFPRGTEGILIAFGDADGAQALRRALLEHDQAGVVLRMANDAGAGQRDGVAREGDVAELLVLVAELPALDAAVQGRALDARGEVAPVGSDHGAGAFGRARRDHAGAGGQELVADGADELEAARRAGLDDDEGAPCGLPEPRGVCEAAGFAERVRGDDQVALGNAAGEIAREDFGIRQPGARLGGEGGIALDHGDGGIRERSVCG